MKTTKPFDRTQVFESAEREATHVALSELNLAERWLSEQRDDETGQTVPEGARWDLSEIAMIELIEGRREMDVCMPLECEDADPVMSDDYVLLDVLDGDLTEDDFDLYADAERADDERWMDEHRYDNYLHEEESYGDVESPSLTFEEAMTERDERMDRKYNSKEAQDEDDWSEYDQPARPRTHGQLRRESHLMSTEDQFEATRSKPDRSRQNRRRTRRHDTIRRAA